MQRQVQRTLWIPLLALSLVLSGLLFLAGGQSAYIPVAKAQDAPSNSPFTGTVPVFLPVTLNDSAQLAQRMGYGSGTIQYPSARELRAGWYLNWGVTATPPLSSGGIEYAQVIFVHQKMACGAFHHRDRAVCPYAQPLDYVTSVDNATIEAVAKARPGSVWLIGNEMDRLDWKYCKVATTPCPPNEVGYTGQSEILPETYAKAYRDLYTLLKTADPTAQVAIGGVIQATPLRLKYLTIVWDTYKTLYGQDMPVDIWNVHAFILQEKLNDYGAEIPPGLTETTGEYIGNDCTHVDRVIFDKQIRAFRQWMKERGQQEKPLYITEYGVLYLHKPNQPNCKTDFNNEKLVVDFMTFTFDYYMKTKDCTLGYTKDECRLVQRWIWFSLDHLFQTTPTVPTSGIANPHSSLINGANGQLTEAGRQFGKFSTENMLDLPK